MFIQRMLSPLKSRSFFLFGARGTGKTTYINRQFQAQSKGEIQTIDLLDPEMEDRFARDPGLLERMEKGGSNTWIFIDEVQKIPKLLDVCHRMIVSKKARFILSGSSARKLRRGGANLLAGRAQWCAMHPFTHRELGEEFDLDTVLRWGGLPDVYLAKTDEERSSILRAYTLVYLKEEIRAEQVVRNLDPFRIFLEISAQMSSRIINHSEIAREAGVDYKTVQTYFSILEETYLGFYLPAYHRSLRKSQVNHPKFYLFDAGVSNALLRNLDAPLNPRTSAYGNAFESFLVTECFRLNSYLQKDFQMSFFSTKDGAEIDLVLSKPNQTFLVEIKSGSTVDPLKVEQFARLTKDMRFGGQVRKLWLSQDPVVQTIKDVECLPWRRGLDVIFNEAEGSLRQ